MRFWPHQKKQKCDARDNCYRIEIDNYRIEFLFGRCHRSDAQINNVRISPVSVLITVFVKHGKSENHKIDDSITPTRHKRKVREDKENKSRQYQTDGTKKENMSPLFQKKMDDVNAVIDTEKDCFKCD
jgi:hypothetical protein